MKRSYHTDLTDAEWRCLEPHVPAPNKRGRPRIHSPRTILDAVFYVLKSGCPWRLLPREFPPWETVYSWFRKWTINGTFERLNAALREVVRSRSGIRGWDGAPGGVHWGRGGPVPATKGASGRRWWRLRVTAVP